MAAESLKKVKILVLGDTGEDRAGRKEWRALTSPPPLPGVGKTSLVHRICHREPLSNPAWTVGCSVEVKVRGRSVSQPRLTHILRMSPQVHEYHRSTTPTDYFLEFWDIGGSPAHRKGCGVFYQQANGGWPACWVLGPLSA